MAVIFWYSPKRTTGVYLKDPNNDRVYVKCTDIWGIAWSFGFGFGS